MSNLFNISTKDDVSNHKVRLPSIYIATTHFELPCAFNPLTNALKSSNVLQKRIRLGVIESEFNDILLSCSKLSFQVVALEVLSIFLKYN